MRTLLLSLAVVTVTVAAGPALPPWILAPATADYSISVSWEGLEDRSALNLLVGNIAAALGFESHLEGLDTEDDQLVRTDIAGAADRCRVETHHRGSESPVVRGDEELREPFQQAREGRKPCLGSLASVRGLWSNSKPAALNGYISPRKLLFDEASADWALGGVLSRLPGVAVQATGEENPQFSMWTDAASESDARFLAAEIRNFFPDGGNNELLAQIRRSLDVTVDGRRVRVALRLSRGGLQELTGSQIASRFIRWELSVPRERRIHIRRLFDLLGAQPGSRLADIGSGRGFATVRMARAVGPSGRVVAVDIDPGVLTRLRERLDEQGLTNVEVVQGETDNPRLDAGSLDGVFIMNAYHEMNEYPAMLAHIKRALRPGGRLVILEPFDPERADRPRAAQVGDHHISGDLVEKDLIEAGYRVVLHDPSFVVDPSHDHDHREVLLVAEPIAEQ